MSTFAEDETISTASELEAALQALRENIEVLGRVKSGLAGAEAKEDAVSQQMPPADCLSLCESAMRAQEKAVRPSLSCALACTLPRCLQGKR